MTRFLRLDDGLRRSGGSLALAALVFGVTGCDGGPGTFELDVDPAAVTIAAGTRDLNDVLVPGMGAVDVIIQCGTNTNEFLIVLSLEGVPDSVEVSLSVGSSGSFIDCGSGDPPRSPLTINVGLQAPGVYPMTLRGLNFPDRDIALTEPNTERAVTLTLTVQ